MDVIPKNLPTEVKRDVVTVARRGDLGLAKPASDFNVSVESGRRWTRNADIDHVVCDGLTSSEQSELVQLRRDKCPLKMENEILPRATHISRRKLPQNEVPGGP
jgi:transposase